MRRKHQRLRWGFWVVEPLREEGEPWYGLRSKTWYASPPRDEESATYVYGGKTKRALRRWLRREAKMGRHNGMRFVLLSRFEGNYDIIGKVGKQRLTYWQWRALSIIAERNGSQYVVKRIRKLILRTLKSLYLIEEKPCLSGGTRWVLTSYGHKALFNGPIRTDSRYEGRYA